MNIISKTITGFISLIQGLLVTLSNALKKPVTIMYPYEKEDLPKESRQRLQMNYENGISKCKACRICERACPQKAIEIETEIIDGKPKLKIYNFDPEKCMYCGICTEKCPFNAISWSQDFRMARNAEEGKLSIIPFPIRQKSSTVSTETNQKD